MKKSKISILLLLVMILSITAVSAADDVSSNLDDSQTIDVDTAPAPVTSAEGQGVLKSSDNTEILTDSGDKNFTTLQNEVDSSSTPITLSSNYTRVDGEDDICIDGKMVYIMGNGYTIDANNLGGIFKVINGGALVLQGVTLVNGNANLGGAVEVEEGGTLSVINSKFINNTAMGNGGAIDNYKGTVTISGSTIFDGNKAFNGGAICSKGGLSVMDAIFDNNYAEYGASILNFQGTLNLANVISYDERPIYNDKGTITSKVIVTILDNDTVPVDSLNVLITAIVADENDNEIIDNTLSFLINDEEIEAVYNETAGNYQANYTLPSGGYYTVNAVSSTGSNLEVETGIIKCTIGTFTDLQNKINDAIDNNEETLTFDYGFKYVPGLDDETLSNGINIAGNVLFIDGNGYTIDANGAEGIFVINTGNIVLFNTTFINSVYHAIVNNADLTITSSVFKDNFCPDEGTAGGAAILNLATLLIKECAFENNTATKYGGAICSGGYLEVIDSNFTSNNATYGAAIVARDFKISGGMFSENIAQSGTVYVAKGTSTITDATFSENECNVGGAIYMINGNLEIYSSVFTGNTAEERAEAIYVASERASLNITDSVFSQNGGSKKYSIVNRGTLSLSGNDVDNYIYNGGTIVKAYAIVLGNDTFIPESDDVVITAVVWDDMNNTIVDTSFVFIINDDETISATFDGEMYTANYTLPEYGKLYTINMSSSRYEELEVLTGAFYNIRGTFTDLQSKIDDAIDAGEILELPYDFTYNEAIDGEYFKDGVEINGLIVINGNEYTINGNKTSRIFYITEDGSLIISNANLANGVALYGGAIFIDGDGYLEADNVIFYNNTAINGGAISANGEGSIILINNSAFADNSATDAGSAIYVEGIDSLTIDNSEFIGNIATDNAAIQTYSVYDVIINSTYFYDNNGAVSIDVDSSVTIENSTFEECGEYPIYNLGVLSLNDNEIATDAFIYNGGFISSTVYSLVMDNETYITLDDTFPINATLVDDNGNLIYDPNFKFTSNGVPIEEEWFYYDGLYMGSVDIGFVAENVISVDDDNYADLNVLVGIIKNGNVGTYTDLQAQINAAIEAGEETFTLPYNFTYFEEIDGGKFNSGIILDVPITIIGNGNYIDGAGLVRVFDVETDGVILKDIEFINGRATKGGAIYTCADLEIYNCTFYINTADEGNAIYAVTLLDDVTNVIIEDSTFFFNGDYDEFAISNDNANIKLYGNDISNVIYNNGTINGYITVLDGEIVNATYGQSIVLNASFVDDQGNYIYDPNLEFVIEDVADPIPFDGYDFENGVCTVTYVANTVGLKEVSINDLEYEYLYVQSGYLNISKTNVSLTVTANNIIRKQNETITVYLYDLLGNPLNLTVRVFVYDKNSSTIDEHIEATVNGTFSYNVTGLAVGEYVVTAVFESVEGYNFNITQTSFIVDEYILPGSYMDLQKRINAAIAEGNTTFILPYDFSYIEDCDEDFFPDGVVISAPINIDGNGSTISGNNSYRIFLVNASDVNITDIWFVNGTSEYGGAILVLVNDTYVSISDSVFVNNTALYGGAIFNNADLTIDGCLFDNNTAIYNGGAVATVDNLTVTDSSFTNNIATGDEITAGNGGAIATMNAGDFTLVIDNTLFAENTAVAGDHENLMSGYSWGGAIDTNYDTIIMDSEFFNNTADYGAVSITFGPVYISDSYFEDNVANVSGGAIYNIAGELEIEDSNFTGNKAIEEGGAILNSAAGTLIIEGSDFTENEATWGGAIYNVMEGELSAYAEITDSTFIDNSAVIAGAIANEGTLAISDSLFAGNTAEIANAIGVANGELYLDNNIINTEAADVVVGDEGKIGSYVNVTILDNSTLDVVEDTYIIYAKITDDMGNLIEAEGFEFVINDEETVPATYNATTGLYEYVFEIPDEPAVYYVNMTYIETEMLDTHIGILRYIRGTYTDLQNRILDTEENGTLELPYNFAYTESIDGMAFQFGVIIFQPINIDGNDYVISGSDSYRIFLIGASNVNITDVVFANGNATDDESLGGAILVAGDAENVTIADSLFVNNTAAYGGAIFFVGENGVVDGVWFINNTAENKGGAIYWKGNYGLISGISMDEDPLPTEMTLFINNTAGEKGGAIHVVGNNFTIENSGFMGNNATDGGAVSVVGSDVTLDHNMFIYNNAADGGAVYITEDAEGIIIDDSLFFANNATEHGGAIYSEGKDLYVFDTQFYQNGALYGGAITTFNRTAIINSTFALNEAEYYGGAIYANDMLGVAESKFEDNTAMFGNAILMGEGDLYLSENEINTEAADVVLTYNSAIDSDVNVTVLGNDTVEIFGFDAILNATITDDNGNLIEAPYFKFIINDEEINATYNNETNLYEAEYTLPEISVYPVSMTYVNTDNLAVYIGIISNLKTGTYTDLQRRIDIALENGEDLVLPYNFTYNEAIDGDDFPYGVEIWDDLNIDANGFTISANNSDVNVLTIDEGCEVTIENAIITGVNGTNIEYGAVINHGDLTLNNCTIIDNTFTKASYGIGAAAIFNDGINLVINGSYIAHNYAPFDSSLAAVLIKSAGDVYINDTVFEDNSANLGGAIHVMLNNEPVIIEGCVFYNNIAFKGQDIISDSELIISDSYFVVDGDDTLVSIINGGSLDLSGSTVVGSVYNEAQGTLALDSNKVTGFIFNEGTITTLTNATFLDNQTIPAELGDEVLVYGILTDDNGNAIWDDRFDITVNGVPFSGEDLTLDSDTKILYTNYTIEQAGLNVVSTTYDATVINIGIFDVPKANVTQFSVVVGGQDNRIPYGENATVYVELLGIEGIGLNETITVIVNDVPYTVDVIDGEAQFNVSGLEPGDYSATGLFINNINYNDAYATGLFTILEPDAILIVEADDITVGDELEVTIHFTDAFGDPIAGLIYVEIGDWYDLIGVYGDTTFTVPGLAVGNYSAYVRFDGDERYGRLSNNTTFQVTRIVDYDFIAEAEITPFDEQPVWVYIELPDFATGNVTITINGTTYNATVEDGEAIIVIDDFLDIGEYLDVEVAYSGDDIYAPGTTTVDIVVIPIDPELEAELEFTMIAYLDNATIYAFVNLGATGNILVYDHITEELLANVTVEEAEEGINIAGLSAGTYFFDVIYTGDDYYYADAVYELELEVIKIYPELNIEVTGDLVVDGEVNITFTTPEDADGFVSIYVDGEKVEYTGENGTYTVTINNFAAGTHTVMGVLEWDTNYDDDYVVDTFEISKIDPELEINVTGEAVADGSVTITITLPEDAEGFVLIDINDKTSYAVPEDGIVTVEIDDLAATIYEISVTYTGDDKYEEDWNFAIIDVAKANSTIEIYGPDEADVGEDFIVYVFVTPATATGNYSIFIDGVDVTAEYGDTSIFDGEGSFIVSGLAAGNHTIGVQYNGDENYNASDVAEYTVEVNRVNTTEIIVVIGDEIQYGDVATVVVVLPEDATGTVRVIANGKYLFADVIEGVAVVNITDLEVGEYEFDVGYKGDGKYDGYDGFVNVTVTVADPDFEIWIEDNVIDYRESALLEIYLNESATGNVEIWAYSYDDDDEWTLLYNITVEEAREGVFIEDLTVGTYYIVAVYSGDKNFDWDFDEEYLYVEKIDPELAIEVTGDLVVDGEVNITFITPEDADGIITILVDGEEVPFTGENGTYTVTVNDFIEGLHTVVGYIEFDSNYNDLSAVETFYIGKVDPTVEITVEPSEVVTDGTVTVTVTVPEDATGYVMADVNGMSFYGVVEDGKFIFDIDGLEAMTYDIVVTYTGDDKYFEGVGYSNFTVGKAESFVEIDGPDEADVDEEFIVYVYVTPETATGNYSVFIDGIDVTDLYDELIIVDGEGAFIVPGLTAGEHTIGVIYNGDDNYNASALNEYTIVINKINVTEDDIFIGESVVSYGENSTIYVEFAFEDATGNVTVTVNGTDYVAPVEDGVALIVLPAFPVGDYEDLPLVYSGDDKYNEFVTTADFYVNKAFIDWGLDEVPDEIEVWDEIVLVLNWTDPEGAQGNLSVLIDGEEYGVFTFDEMREGILVDVFDKSGIYNITVAALDDPNYDYAEPIELFIFVDTIDAEMEVNVTEEPQVGDVIEATVTLPEDATGTVYVAVDGEIVAEGVELVNGTATIDLGDLAAGNHTIVVAYSGDEVYSEDIQMITFEVAKADPELIVEVEDITVREVAVINITLPDDATRQVLVEFNGAKTYYDLVDGKASFDAEGLPVGEYTVTVTYIGNDKYNEATTQASFVVNKIDDYDIEINSTSPREGDNATVTVTVPEDATGNVTVTDKDGNNYTAPIENGTATVEVPSLPEGNNTLTVDYSGDDIYDGKTSELNVTVRSAIRSTTLYADVLVKYEGESAKYNVTLIDEDGFAVVGVPINMTIVGKTYHGTTDENGTAYLPINLKPGIYNITAEFGGQGNYTAAEPLTTEVHVLTKVRLDQNKDLVKDYGDDDKYTIRALDEYGKPIAGVVVNMTIVGKTYHAKTNEDGIASLAINLKPGSYDIVCYYADYIVTNNIVVKQVLSAPDKQYKKASSYSYTATLKHSNGAAISGKTVTFTLKGQTYTANTNAKGEATISIAQSLSAGSYKIAVKYIDSTITKTITIK